MIENKHMNTTNDDNDMTGIADNCDPLRTKSGQGNPVIRHQKANLLWGTVIGVPFTSMQIWVNFVSDVKVVAPTRKEGTGFCRPEMQPPPPPEPAAPTPDLAVQLASQLVEVTRQRDHERVRASKCSDYRLAALSAEDALEKITKQRDALVMACRMLLASPEVQGSWPLNGTKRAQKPSDTYSKAEAKVKFRHLLKIHAVIEQIDAESDHDTVEKLLGMKIEIDDTLPPNTAVIRGTK